MTAYTSAAITVDAVQFTAGNRAEVKAFAGEDFIGEGAHSHLWIRNAEGPFEIHEGYWLSRIGGAPIVLTAPAAWERHQFRPADGTDEAPAVRR